MRRCLFAKLFAVLVVSLAASSQVMEDMSYRNQLRRAESLLAGTSAADVPHHIHYDLKLYDRDGRETAATYDIYRDPVLYERVDIKTPAYQLTHITNVRDHVNWFKYTGGDMPLKISDFQMAFDRPYVAIERLKEQGVEGHRLYPQQYQGAPLLCVGDDAGTSICFNPMIHMFAFAQMFNQTIMYDQWLPIGAHTVPGSIRVYQDKKLLLDAEGTVEAVKKFPADLLRIPGTPSQPDPSAGHKVTQYKPVNMSRMIFGGVQVGVSVDQQGKVTKLEIVDSDDKRLEGYARKTARGAIFEPQMENGKAVPFDTSLYLRYYPSP